MLFPSASAGAIVGAGSGADGCVTINSDMLLGLPVQVLSRVKWK